MNHTQTDKIIDLAADLASKADDIDQVLIIYRKKSGGDKDTCVSGSMDNDMEVRDALWLIENYRLWLLGVRVGDRA